MELNKALMWLVTTQILTNLKIGYIIIKFFYMYNQVKQF